jgi:hypothetical protein
MDKENRDALNKWLADKTGPTPCYTDEHIELLWERIVELEAQLQAVTRCYEQQVLQTTALDNNLVELQAQVAALKEAAKAVVDKLEAAPIRSAYSVEQAILALAALLKEGGDE